MKVLFRNRTPLVLLTLSTILFSTPMALAMAVPIKVHFTRYVEMSVINKFVFLLVNILQCEMNIVNIYANNSIIC